MPTFQQAFCAAHRCSIAEFTARVFWRTLPPHAWLIARLLGGSQSRFFAADRAFIASAGGASNLAQIREEIRDFCLNSENRRWWRRRAHVRISCRRLKALARRYLADSAAIAPAGPVAPAHR